MRLPWLGSALLAVACCAALPAARSVACGYHGSLGDGFSAQHPGSIDVAIAVREAIDNGLLTSPKPLPAFLALTRANRTLEDVRTTLAAQMGDGRSPGNIAVLLVEAGLWTRYRIDAGRLVSEPHVTGPLPGDVVIVTAEPVLQALIDGRLATERAVADGLLLVADPAGSRATVFDTLRGAFTPAAASLNQ